MYKYCPVSTVHCVQYAVLPTKACCSQEPVQNVQLLHIEYKSILWSNYEDQLLYPKILRFTLHVQYLHTVSA